VTRVLLCSDESPASLAATRALRAAGYAPWLACSQAGTAAARSRDAAGATELAPPHADPDAYATAVAELAAIVGAHAVLPATEGSLRALTGREERFGVPVGTCEAERLERATDKLLLARESARFGLRSPATVELGPDDAAPEIGFPVLVKPLRSVSEQADGTLRNVEVTRVDSAAHLAEARARARGPVLVQEHVAGRLAAVSGVVWRGRLVRASHQVSLRIWPPERGITAYGLTVPADPELEAGVAALLAWIGWSGVFQAQFIDAPQGRFLIDLNPRLYGSLGLAVAAGLNLPAIWADLLLGREPRVGTPRVGQRYRVEEDDVRALAAAFRAGRRREALAGLLPRPQTAHATFSLRDPRPFGAVLAKAAQRLRSSPSSASTS
jgi:predicted ATP-grasp superfamily ATP-dependent carboligase